MVSGPSLRLAIRRAFTTTCSRRGNGLAHFAPGDALAARRGIPSLGDRAPRLAEVLIWRKFSLVMKMRPARVT